VEHVPWARDLARRLLAEPLPNRWAHTEGVGRKAESIARLVGEDASLLICAAWLHDIGYAPGLVKTYFHPLDGARYLRDFENARDQLCRLVANHSHALVEASSRGLADELDCEFPYVDGLLADALTYCDMTTSPEGNPIDVEARLNEIASRYGSSDVVAVSIRKAQPKILRSVTNVITRLPHDLGGFAT
jgi:hypothetical protein